MIRVSPAFLGGGITCYILKVLTCMQALSHGGGLYQVTFAHIAGDEVVELFDEVFPLHRHFWPRQKRLYRRNVDNGVGGGRRVVRMQGRVHRSALVTLHCWTALCTRCISSQSSLRGKHILLETLIWVLHFSSAWESVSSKCKYITIRLMPETMMDAINSSIHKLYIIQKQQCDILYINDTFKVAMQKQKI